MFIIVNCIHLLITDSAPDDGESFDEIMRDLEPKIMSGVMHWNHPGFHAYFPSANSFPSILGDLLSDAIGAIGFSWVNSILNFFSVKFK